MHSNMTIFEQLNPTHFWDVNISVLGPHAAKRLIIERVFTRGELNEIKSVLEYYGEEQVLQTLYTLPFLEPKNLNFISKFFNKPRKEFRCYHRKQSKPQH